MCDDHTPEVSCDAVCVMCDDHTPAVIWEPIDGSQDLTALHQHFRGIRGDQNDKRTRAFAVEKDSDILPQNNRS